MMVIIQIRTYLVERVGLGLKIGDPRPSSSVRKSFIPVPENRFQWRMDISRLLFQFRSKTKFIERYDNSDSHFNQFPILILDRMMNQMHLKKKKN